MGQGSGSVSTSTLLNTLTFSGDLKGVKADTINDMISQRDKVLNRGKLFIDEKLNKGLPLTEKEKIELASYLKEGKGVTIPKSMTLSFNGASIINNRATQRNLSGRELQLMNLVNTKDFMNNKDIISLGKKVNNKDTIIKVNIPKGYNKGVFTKGKEAQTYVGKSKTFKAVKGNLGGDLIIPSNSKIRVDYVSKNKSKSLVVYVTLL